MAEKGSKGGKVVAAVEEAVKPVIEQLGFELVDIEYVKEGPDWYLRIYADKKGGIGIDDCATISQAVDPIIDGLDVLQSAYIFEVSSPGLDRPLKNESDFKRYEGETVDVSLYAAIDGAKQYTGKLLPKSDGFVSIEIDGAAKHFDEKAVSLVKRAIVF